MLKLSVCSFLLSTPSPSPFTYSYSIWQNKLKNSVVRRDTEFQRRHTNNKKKGNSQSSILILLSPSAAFFPLIFVITFPIHPDIVFFLSLSSWISSTPRFPNGMRAFVIAVKQLPEWAPVSDKRMCIVNIWIFFLEVVVLTVSLRTEKKQTKTNKFNTIGQCFWQNEICIRIWHARTLHIVGDNNRNRRLLSVNCVFFLWLGEFKFDTKENTSPAPT